MPRFTQAELEAYLARRHAGRLVSQRPPASGPSPRESAIQQAIAQHLDRLGHECYYVWHRTDAPTTCAVGTADFIGWRRGVPFALEVKRPGGKETREQAGQLLRAQLAGARVAVVHSLTEAVAFLATL